MQKKILISEDEQALSKALALKLEHAGFEVLTVSDGEEALKAIADNKDIVLILLDLMMPKKDGFEVLEVLQEKGSKIPVIVLSNLGQEEDVERAKKLGAKDYFVKADTPINEIADHVRSLLHE